MYEAAGERPFDPSLILPTRRVDHIVPLVHPERDPVEGKTEENIRTVVALFDAHP